MSVLVFLLFGVLLGLIAKALAPGVMPLLKTLVVGVAGALVGGLLVTWLAGIGIDRLLPGNVFASIIGGIVFLAVYARGVMRSAAPT